MGCHMWLYKKAKNLTREEKQRLVENNHKYCYRNFVQNVSREDFIKSHVKEYLENLEKFDKLGIPHDDFQYEFAKEYSNPENVGKWYDESVQLNKERKEAYEAFIKDPDSVDIVEILKTLVGDYSATLKYYKYEWYVNTTFDTYFRCYKYGDHNIDNYEDMINYLEPLADSMIHQYGDFDKDGNFHYFDNENYTPKKGLTNELKNMLKYLYKDNDIFIEFA